MPQRHVRPNPKGRMMPDKDSLRARVKRKPAARRLLVQRRRARRAGARPGGEAGGDRPRCPAWALGSAGDRKCIQPHSERRADPGPDDGSFQGRHQLGARCGREGVIVPLIESAVAGGRSVDAARYPPLGKRSAGGIRPLSGDFVAYYQARPSNTFSVS